MCQRFNEVVMTTISEMKLADKLRAQYVKRWSTVHLTHQQSLAEHSFNVTMIALEISLMVFGEYDEIFSDKVMRYALFHDLDEIVTGDIPTPTKQRLISHAPGIKDLLDTAPPPKMSEYSDETIRHIVKLADIIESAFHVKQHGNGIHALQVAKDVESKMRDAIADTRDATIKNAAWGIWNAINSDQRVW